MAYFFCEIKLLFCISISDVCEKKKTKKIAERHKWTEEEISELHEIFKLFITGGKTPGKAQIEKGLKKSKRNNGNIWKLKGDNVKKKISWIICRSRKD